MEFSLVMVTYNRWDLTRDCLASLWPTLPAAGAEVVVVDNASADATRRELAAMGDRLRFLPQDENRGFAAANNAGARASRGEFLVLVNSDLVFLPGWLEPMRRVFAERPDAGVVGNAQWSPRTGRYDHMGIAFSPKGNPCHFGQGFPWWPFQGVTEWGAVTAACCMVRRSDFLEAGGFDEAFRNGLEDVDLCLRLGRAGRRHYVANRSRVRHWVSSSPGRHDHNAPNEALFRERWGEFLRGTWCRRDRRRHGASYLLGNAAAPWRYSFWKFCRAAGAVLLPGPGPTP